MSPEALGVQGVLDILELLGHLEDQGYRSLEDLDLLSLLECLATLGNGVKTKPFSKKSGKAEICVSGYGTAGIVLAAIHS